jgi:hypothetical protein
LANRPFKTQPFYISSIATVDDAVVYSFYKERINTIQNKYPNELLMGMIYDGRYNAIYAVYSNLSLNFYESLEDKLHFFNYGTRQKTDTDNTDKKNVGVEIDEDLEKVLKIIKENEMIKSIGVAKIFNKFSHRQIERFIKELKKLGKIEYIGSARYGGYMLLK